MKSHCSREKYIENYRECDLELRAIHSLKGKCKRVKFESLCGLEVTGHTIAGVYFDKWKALSSFVHFFSLIATFINSLQTLIFFQ